MKIKNVNIPIGAVLEVREDFGEYLLKALGGRFVAVPDTEDGPVEAPAVEPDPAVVAPALVEPEKGTPRKGKRR
jgi:hypothetical protein